MEGYIKLSRKLLESDIWYKPPLYLKVWIYLLCHATHKQYGNLQRGQLVTSIRKIQEALTYQRGATTNGPTYEEVRRIVEFMRDSHVPPTVTPIDTPMESTDVTPIAEPMITTKRVTGGLLVTIVKYDEYQRDEREEIEPIPSTVTPIDFGDVMPSVTPHVTPILIDNKKGNKNDNKKEGITYGVLETGEAKTPVPLPAPSSILDEIQNFESYHHSPQLTKALHEWLAMRTQRGKTPRASDMPILLQQVSDFSQGDVNLAIAIVQQSIRKRWSQFWELSHKGGSGRNEPLGPPPPRIEDYPGDPDGFQEAVHRWQMQAPAYEPNERIRNRYEPQEPSEEERQRILQRMEETKT